MAQNNNTAHLPLPLPLKILRALYPIIQTLIPPLAKKIGVGFFLKPFRFPLPEREKAVNEQATVEEIKVGGQTIKVYEWNKGKPYLLMVHGWSGRAMQFHAFIEHFTQKGFGVLSFDAPGHGKSTGGETNIVEFAECIKSIIDLKGEPFALIGHSLGGIACMFYQRWNETEIPQIIINSPAIPDEIFENYAIRLNAKKERVEEWIRAYTLKKFERDFDEVSGKELSKNIKKAPFLMVYDENDREVSLANAQVLTENMPWAQYFQTQGFGHVRILRADVVLQRIEEFIEALPNQKA